MKSSGYQHRFYRNWVNTDKLYTTHVITKETDLHIFTDKKLDQEFVKEKIRSLRWDIESYIDRDRRFLSSLKPIEVEFSAPGIVKRMSEAANISGVGPMAAVAGAIVEFLGKALLKKSCKDVIIENGGDLFIKSRRNLSVGIYAGTSKFSKTLNIHVKAKDTPLGICTSSGTIGHSLSFGCADSVVIVSKSAILADAAVTATANRINSKKDLQRAVDFARSLKGVLGILIIIENNLIASGRIEFVK